MAQVSKRKKGGFFERFANKMTTFTGSSTAFTSAVLIVLIWAASGPLFDFSETWQLVINTGTTIITFLMVFLIQKTQNKDSLALHLKLNELVASSRFASNRLVDVEDLTEEELEILKKYYMKLSDLSEEEDSLIKSHSIDDAQENHAEKSGRKPQKKLSNSDRGKSVSIEEIGDIDKKRRQKRRKPRPKND